MYAKVFSQIFDGTLCTVGPWESLVTFQQLLILADQEGHVDMTATAISRRTTIPIEIIEKGIAALLLPDPESRTPTEEGRRIVPLSEGRAWGWRIVNYKHYRQLKREEDRRSYHRDYWHTRKDKTQHTQHTQQTQPNQPIAEAKAEAINKTGVRFDEFWDSWPKNERKQDKKKCRDRWQTARCDALAEKILADISLRKQGTKWADPKYIEAPLVYLNNERWNDGFSLIAATKAHNSYSDRVAL